MNERFNLCTCLANRSSGFSRISYKEHPTGGFKMRIAGYRQKYVMTINSIRHIRQARHSSNPEIAYRTRKNKEHKTRKDTYGRERRELILGSLWVNNVERG